MCWLEETVLKAISVPGLKYDFQGVCKDVLMNDLLKFPFYKYFRCFWSSGNAAFWRRPVSKNRPQNRKILKTALHHPFIRHLLVILKNFDHQKCLFWGTGKLQKRQEEELAKAGGAEDEDGKGG